MKADILPRKFKFDGQLIDDPNPDYSLEQVSEFLGEQFPEIINAKFTGPKHENDTLVYEIGTVYGTKG